MVQSFAGDLFAMTNDAETDLQNIENAINTLKSSFSGSTAPSAEQGQLWYDTNRALLRHRGAASNWRGVIAFKDDASYLNITKIWVYANAVEEGFSEDTDCADCVISIKGGSQAYSATGGDGTPRGTWTQPTYVLQEADLPIHTHAISGDGREWPPSSCWSPSPWWCWPAFGACSTAGTSSRWCCWQPWSVTFWRSSPVEPAWGCWPRWGSPLSVSC